MSRTVAFRADASLQIGSGHVMRCLTLAAALREQGVTCHFICREHRGNLIDQIRDRGFAVTALVKGGLHLPLVTQDGKSLPAHAAWLGVTWQVDAEATRGVLQSIPPDWLVVDHYALDRAWEQALRSHCTRLMVIDDLADRPHDCDLLLDQNLGREAADYVDLVPATCTVLTRTRYALLRPQFAALREYSLQRRNPPQLKRLLVTMGGTDQSNATGQVLDALRQCPLPQNCRITVVMGLHAPCLTEVQAQAASSPWPCEVKVNVSNMAQLMADSDLAIGAAGSTSWERCVLGLPSLVIITANNQKPVAQSLEKSGAAHTDGTVESIRVALPQAIEIIGSEDLAVMCRSAVAACDGLGTSRVAAVLDGWSAQVRSMREDDLQIVLQWRNHPEIRRWMCSSHVITPSEHYEWYAHANEDERRHLLIVEDAGVRIGFVQFTEIGSDRVADWGFYAAPNAPHGSGKKLTAAALDYAFTRIGLRKVCGKVIISNQQSIILHRKLGFAEEHVIAGPSPNDAMHPSVHYFSLEASNWLRHQRK